jgi:hypothetical protein
VWIVGGDLAGVITLYVEFGNRLPAAVHRELRHPGVECADCSGAWDHDGGALPWVWAEWRVANVVRSFVGEHRLPATSSQVALR